MQRGVILNQAQPIDKHKTKINRCTAQEKKHREASNTSPNLLSGKLKIPELSIAKLQTALPGEKTLQSEAPLTTKCPLPPTEWDELEE